MRRLDIISRIVATAMRYVWGRVAPLFTGMGSPTRSSHSKGLTTRLTTGGIVGICFIAMAALVACPSEDNKDDGTVPMIASVDADDTDEGSGSSVTITLNIALPSSVSGASVGYDLAGDATGGATAADVDDFSGASLTGHTATATIGSNRAMLTFTTVATLNDIDEAEQARVTVTGIAFTPDGQVENISGATENNSATFTITPAPPPMPTISSVDADDTGEGSGSSVTITLDLALPASVSSASISYDLAGDATGGATAADADDFSGVSLTGHTATATIGGNRAMLTFTTVATLNDGDGDEQARVTVTGIAFTPTGQAENISGAIANNSATFTIGASPPVFSAASYSFGIAEGDYSDQSAGAVGTVSAMPATRYAISSGDTDNRFAIDPASGVLTAVGALDFETTSSYSLTLTAHNGAGNAAPMDSAMVAITVTDIQTGMADEPYTIASLTQLRSINTAFANDYTTANAITLTRDQSLVTHYLLTKDLNFDEDENGMQDDTYTTGSGWQPIAHDTINADYPLFTGMSFTGSFDGGGYVIRNLFINRSGEDHVGLFGQIGNSGVVDRLGLEGVNILGSEAVGGLVGLNRGMVSNSYATGVVSIGQRSEVGGLVGSNVGTITTSYSTATVSGQTDATSIGGLVGNNSLGTISNSYATGSVSGPVNSAFLGGFVGSNTGTISNSYATGSVSGPVNSAALGGFVGSNTGAISNSYATGSVSGVSSVGGLVGFSGNDGTISTSYSTGRVTLLSGSATTIGGLVGLNFGTSMVRTSYWNRETSGQGASAGGLGATGRTTEEMYVQANFMSWDFTTIWHPPSATNMLFPLLRGVGTQPADQ